MSKVVSVAVECDDILRNACTAFDYRFDGTSTFALPSVTPRARDGSWAIGLITGPSGSGKTLLAASHYGITPAPSWDATRAVASHFSSSADAIERLTAVGLNSIPSWCKPYHVLSTGEQFRCNVARVLGSDVAVDEFTSVVDRTVAKATSYAVQRHIRSKGLSGVVFVSCHRDIIEWLMPDWVIDTLDESVSSGRLVQRPSITVSISQCSWREWGIFRHHHYLSRDINKAARCYLATIGNYPVGFMSCLSMPIGTIKNAWREHRTVVLPDYQGLGIGVRLSDWLGAFNVSLGRRYFSKTTHPRMGEYRNNSPLWKPTSKNGLVREFNGKGTYNNMHKSLRTGVACYSHEYVGSMA